MNEAHDANQAGAQSTLDRYRKIAGAPPVETDHPPMVRAALKVLDLLGVEAQPESRPELGDAQLAAFRTIAEYLTPPQAARRQSWFCLRCGGTKATQSRDLCLTCIREESGEAVARAQEDSESVDMEELEVPSADPVIAGEGWGTVTCTRCGSVKVSLHGQPSPFVCRNCLEKGTFRSAEDSDPEQEDGREGIASGLVQCPVCSFMPAFESPIKAGAKCPKCACEPIPGDRADAARQDADDLEPVSQGPGSLECKKCHAKVDSLIYSMCDNCNREYNAEAARQDAEATEKVAENPAPVEPDGENYVIPVGAGTRICAYCRGGKEDVSTALCISCEEARRASLPASE